MVSTSVRFAVATVIVSLPWPVDTESVPEPIVIESSPVPEVSVTPPVPRITVKAAVISPAVTVTTSLSRAVLIVKA